eukprot:scaffold210546_cov18-Tisochrysis_lutea.AAC.1
MSSGRALFTTTFSHASATSSGETTPKCLEAAARRPSAFTFSFAASASAAASIMPRRRRSSASTAVCCSFHSAPGLQARIVRGIAAGSM